MQFQLNTDSHILGDERLAQIAESAVTSALGHLTDRLSRIEVHLVDVNGAKGGADDIKCTIEARPEGMQPQTVTHSDADVETAMRGAGKKLRALLDNEFGKLDKRR
ncbi:HPF/RaiA family ribosome-associated protein [Roseovarius sp. EGI FJ00037]|uniref:HPF/RaiA family ribosome-associated protein n=1 Tax=Roseovarius salincola TaxID=2978479 RepID=UPI0022A8B188|nr:HPF/RaiA family ribosome-associated protein [Roseovarius sp. EGI FJ00037]MCZ0812344.1 HPF/RaiA family ribosome-associated protein [Roseovarius sp. EGI FJ00037]